MKSQEIDSLLEDLLFYTNQRLIEFAQSDKFNSVLAVSFGTEDDTTTVETLQEALLSGGFFNGIEVEVLPSETLQGALGAYAATTNTIYLSQGLLESSLEEATAVLLEEVGHAIDHYLNGEDSAGDEGAIFAELVLGNELSKKSLAPLQQEKDTKILNIDGQEVLVEQSSDDSWEPNDSLSSAYDLTPYEGIWGEGVMWDDDWYKIELTQNATLTAELTFAYPVADLTLWLYDAWGNPITHQHSNTGTQVIETDLPSGIYYLKVVDAYISDGLSYNLRWNAENAVEDDAYEENDSDTRGNGSYDLSNYADTWLSNILGEGVASDEDWYEIELTNNATLSVDLEFSHAEGDINLALWDFNDELVTYSISETDNESIEITVPTGGTYYVVVGPYQSSGNTYDLRWNTDGESNNVPIASADSLTTNQETALSVNAENGVLANDSDPDGDTLTITAVNGDSNEIGNPITLESGALLTLNTDGSFNYDPNGQFEDLDDGDTDSDSFTYTVSDGNGNSDTATVTITINAPIISNTITILQENAPQVVPVSSGFFVDFAGTQDRSRTFNIEEGAGANNLDAGATINLTGTSSDFTYRRDGSTLEILDGNDNLTAEILASPDTTSAVNFDDGSTEVAVAGGEITFGGESFEDGEEIDGAITALTLQETDAGISELSASQINEAFSSSLMMAGETDLDTGDELSLI